MQPDISALYKRNGSSVFAQEEKKALHAFVLNGILATRTEGNYPPYITLASWMVMHECSAHMGCEDTVSEIVREAWYDESDFTYGSTLRVMLFDEVEPMQKLNGLCGPDHFKYDAVTNRYQPFDPGFPSDHPSPAQQLAIFAYKHQPEHKLN